MTTNLSKSAFFAQMRRAYEEFKRLQKLNEGQATSMSDFCRSAEKAAQAAKLPLVPLVNGMQRTLAEKTQWEMSPAGVLAELFIAEHNGDSPVALAMYTMEKLEELWQTNNT